MRLLVPTPRPGAEARRGAALMVSIMVMVVLLLIVFQISMSTNIDERVATNDVNDAVFDGVIESALMRTLQDLADDGETEQETGAGMAGGLGGGGLPGAGGGGGEEEAGPVDSRRDVWAKPQQTAINEVNVRVLVQDEDSKYNIMTMLTANEEEAEKAYDRVVRILDYCREGTLYDIDSSTAREMADSMRDHMQRRDSSVLPDPVQLTDLQDQPDRGMPGSLREFKVLPAFTDHHFNDFFDAEGNAVHAITSFLTIWTSVKTYDDFIASLETAGGPTSQTTVDGAGQGGGPTTDEGGAAGAGGAGGVGGLSSGNSGGGLGGALDGVTSGNGEPGIAVNVNTAPNAVLHGLFDRRDVPWDFLDEVVQYRNDEDEEAQDPDAEPVYDEYGEEIVELKIFESLEELAEVEGYDYIEPEIKRDFERFLTVKSEVFSVFVTARVSTAQDGEDGFETSKQAEKERIQRGTDRVKTVRVVVWRYIDGEDVKMVVLEPWEVLDYTPMEIEDFPDDY